MNLNRTPAALILLLLISPLAHSLEVNIERVDDSGLPWGYTDVSDFGVDEDPARLARQNSLIWDHERSIQVSEAPFIDYMVAFNSGIPGVLAEKNGGAYLEASQSTIGELTGGSNGGIVPDPEDRSTQDRYSSGEMPVGGEKFAVFANWTDGFPLPSLNSWWGVSWGGGIYFGDNKAIAEVEVRVNLASEGPVNVAHLFNDGWYYNSDLGGIYSTPTIQDMPHPTLEGHEFTVTHHSSDGTVIDEKSFVLPSGGGTNVPGVANEYAAQFGVAPASSSVRGDGKYYLINDWRQFYTATITATRQAEGDYLMLNHRSGNVGYRMTLVTLGNDRPWQGDVPFALTPGEYNDNAILGSTYGYSGVWGYSVALGTVYVSLFPDAVYSPDLGWLMAPSGEAADGIFFYRVDTKDWIWALSGLNGQVYDFASGAWLVGS